MIRCGRAGLGALLLVAGGCEATGETPKCGALTRHQCMESKECTLVQVGALGAPYTCRPKQSKCEEGMAQYDLTRTKLGRWRCESRSGCQFDGGGAYCHCRGYGVTTVPAASSSTPKTPTPSSSRTRSRRSASSPTTWSPAPTTPSR